jgi:hypothetical protein
MMPCHFVYIVMEWLLVLTDNNVYLHYTADRTIKTVMNTNILLEFKKSLLTVKPDLIQSLLLAPSPDTGLEPSTSLTGTLNQL